MHVDECKCMIMATHVRMRCNIVITHVRIRCNGNAYKNAMMVVHVRMQCDAIHIDVMHKITCKVKQTGV